MKLLIAFCALVLCGFASADTKPREEPIYLPLNGRPVEVRQEYIERYRCAKGRLVASEESSGRTSARTVLLRCISG
jgi:hypothetical protein